MRTVTFSDKQLDPIIDRRCVLVWEDLTGDEAAGSSFQHEPTDTPSACPRGTGEHNVQLVFLDPKGRMLHAVAGHLDAAHLRDELDFAWDLHRGLKGYPKKAADQRVRKTHERAAKRDREEEREGFFADFARKRQDADHRFVAKNPLMDWRQFSTKKMVGAGSSFFGSKTSVSGGRKGDFKLPADVEAQIAEALKKAGLGESSPKTPQKPKKPSSRPVKL